MEAPNDTDDSMSVTSTIQPMSTDTPMTSYSAATVSMESVSITDTQTSPLSPRALAERPPTPDASQGYVTGTYDERNGRIAPPFSGMDDVLLSRMGTRAPCPPSDTQLHVFHPDVSRLTLRHPNFIASKCRRFTLVEKRTFLDVVRQLQMTNPASPGKYDRKRACYMCLESYDLLFQTHCCQQFICDSCIILVCIHYLYKRYTLHNKTCGRSALPLCLFCPGRDELFSNCDSALRFVLDVCNLLHQPQVYHSVHHKMYKDRLEFLVSHPEDYQLTAEHHSTVLRVLRFIPYIAGSY